MWNRGVFQEHIDLSRWIQAPFDDGIADMGKKFREDTEGGRAHDGKIAGVFKPTGNFDRWPAQPLSVHEVVAGIGEIASIGRLKGR